MKQITCDFPHINTTKAENEIKESYPADKVLQSCKLPPVAGGRVDVLLGIQYTNIFPVAIRQLDCGLTIYQSRIVAHDKEVNALIGGPHTSFEFLAGKAECYSSPCTLHRRIANVETAWPTKNTS